jgi:hypothetical protein
MLFCDAVFDGRMPLPGYTAIHCNAGLSKQDVIVICEWAAAPTHARTERRTAKDQTAEPVVLTPSEFSRYCGNFHCVSVPL